MGFQKEDAVALFAIGITLLGALAALFITEDLLRALIIVASAIGGGGYGITRFSDFFRRPGLGIKRLTRILSSAFLLVSLVKSWLDFDLTDPELFWLLVMAIIILSVIMNSISVVLTDKTYIIGETTPFDLDTAKPLADFSYQVYADSGWSIQNYSVVNALFENTDTDTQWILGKYDNDKEAIIVVAFRGTEGKKWKDLWTDAKFLATGLSYKSGLRGMLERWFIPKRVHSGFFNAYKSLRQEVQKEVQVLVEEMTKKSSQITILVTGHSLGGALATLCAVDLAEKYSAQIPKVEVVMYNFGGPRVGSLRFVEYFMSLVPNNWRVVNTGDPVPSIPPRLNFLKHWLGYRHLPNAQLITETALVEQIGEIHDPPEPLPSKFDPQKEFADAVDEISAALLKLGKTLLAGGMKKHEMAVYKQKLDNL